MIDLLSWNLASLSSCGRLPAAADVRERTRRPHRRAHVPIPVRRV
jgi:hypothetical protein